MKRRHLPQLVMILLLLTAGPTLAVDFSALGGLDITAYDNYTNDTENDLGLFGGIALRDPLPQVDGWSWRAMVTVGLVPGGSGSYSLPGDDRVEYSSLLTDIGLIGEANYQLSEQLYGILGAGLHHGSWSNDVEVYDNSSGARLSETNSSYNETEIALHLGAGYQFTDQLALEGRVIGGGPWNMLRVGLVWYPVGSESSADPAPAGEVTGSDSPPDKWKD